MLVRIKEKYNKAKLLCKFSVLFTWPKRSWRSCPCAGRGGSLKKPEVSVTKSLGESTKWGKGPVWGCGNLPIPHGRIKRGVSSQLADMPVLSFADSSGRHKHLRGAPLCSWYEGITLLQAGELRRIHLTTVPSCRNNANPAICQGLWQAWAFLWGQRDWLGGHRCNEGERWLWPKLRW